MRWSWRYLLALLLAVSVVAALGLAPIQAGDMTVKMSMASDMFMPEDCTGCPGEDVGSGKMGACSQLCAVPALALLPVASPGVIVPHVARLTPLSSQLLHGRMAWPDPHPPKPLGIV